ncbi:LysR substrate-binding domain-containing protein [Amycolatopsis palatopharyngis]|uniref:LysR substrate-binding domain-containing protein n=1 Tax=Amycolatopsis palatopharyngis TaxID=187982 RepID=UPI000E22DD17|nr:LysR substrate-binding domain-containing protein [Amycolatopsis palatopharyngis]
MELQQLRAFLAVAEELHFGRAAERLHIAQPPLSRIIQQLERDLGTRLFDRTTRTVRLTSAGEALVLPARDILDGCRVARASVKAAGLGETGRVRVGFAGPSSHMLIGRLARLVRRQHPGIELNLRSVTYGYEALAQVIEGSMDLAIVRWNSAPPGIASRIVQEEHYVLVVPTAHPLADRDIVSVAELRDEPFIALPADPGSSVRDAFISSCYQAGFAPDIVQVAPDSWTVMALVAAGVGVTFSIDTAVENVPDAGLRMVRLVEGVEPSYARLAWRDNDESPALREVLKASETALPVPLANESGPGDPGER